MNTIRLIGNNWVILSGRYVLPMKSIRLIELAKKEVYIVTDTKTPISCKFRSKKKAAETFQTLLLTLEGNNTVARRQEGWDMPLPDLMTSIALE